MIAASLRKLTLLLRIAEYRYVYGIYGVCRLERLRRCRNLLESFVLALSASSRFPTARSAISPYPRRIGFLGAFSGLLSFPPDVFLCAPQEMDLFVYDIPYKSTARSQLEGFVNYRELRLVGGDFLSETKQGVPARIINDDQLDVLFVIREKHDAFALLSYLDVPAIVSVNTGSHMSFHSRVALESFVQRPWGYVRESKGVRDLRTNTLIPTCADDICLPLLFHVRGAEISCIDRTSKDKKAIYYWGSLYKIDSDRYLTWVRTLLASLPWLEFHVWGKGSEAQVASIRGKLTEFGGRFVYHGAFDAAYEPSGDIRGQDSWAELVARVKSTGGLFLQSFPVGSATSVVEATAFGLLALCVMPPFSLNLEPPECPSMILDFLFRAGGSFPCDEEMLAAAKQHLQDPKGTSELTAAQQKYAIQLGSKARFWNDIVSMAAKALHIAIARSQITASCNEDVPQ